MNIDPSTDALSQLLEDELDTFQTMVGEYRTGRHPAAPWRLVPAARLVRIWEDAASMGIVRDEKGLQAIRSRVVENFKRLSVNTAVAGHADYSMDEHLDEHFDTDQEKEAFVTWAVETENGMRISDYGLSRLFVVCAALEESTDPMEMLTLIDVALNVAHQRSDLASWFVEGGTATLSRLADGVRPTDKAVPA